MSDHTEQDEPLILAYEEFQTNQRGRVFQFTYFRGIGLLGRFEWFLSDHGWLPQRYVLWRLARRVRSH